MARERGRVLLGRVGVPNQLGEAEIEHLDRAVGADDHVGRLEVAVDDAARVRRDEGVRDGDRNRSASLRRIPWRGMSASRLLPRTYSITMKSFPSADSIS